MNKTELLDIFNALPEEEKNKVYLEIEKAMKTRDLKGTESNFQLIADLWNAYLGDNCCENVEGYACLNDLTPTDVAMMMALLKIARIKNGGSENKED
jgi:hypothetical protein